MKNSKPYFITITAVISVFVLKLLLSYFFNIESPILLFFTAITFSACFGGAAQGFLAIFLTLACIHLYFVPHSIDQDSFGRIWMTRSVFYFIDGSFIVFICSQLTNQKNKVRDAFNEISKAETDLAKANNFLEEHVTERTFQLTQANSQLSHLVKDSERAAERLRESQVFLDSVIENIPNMIFVKEAGDLRFVRFNKAGSELLGQPASNLIGKNDYDLFPKDEADFFTANDREVMAKKKMLEIFEETLSTPQGLRFLHTKKIPILDKHGEPQYLLGISEDITEKKALEQQKIDFMQAQVARSEAEKSAARLEFLAEASVNLSKSLDIHFMLKAFSRTVTKNFADACLVDFYDETDGTVERIMTTFGEDAKTPGMDDWSRKNKLDEDDVAAAQDPIVSVIKDGQAQILNGVENEVVFQAVKDMELGRQLVKNGKASLLVVPLIYHGKVFGTLTLVSTNPGRSYNEFDLSLAQDLARRASFAIENARLFGKANEASRAKSAFLANISHEIRTPLGAMLGFAELALDSKNTTPEEQLGYLSTIIRNGQQLLHIVDEVLDLSKAESDQILVEKIPFSLPRLLEEITSLLMVKALEKNLRFAVQPVGEMPERVTTDPLRLRQILVNIIGNAIKFTERGVIEVLVSVQTTKNKSFLEFVVKDTGIGISTEQATRLFQPFVQADSSMTRKYGGTGLGLFLARKLAKLLGGDVILRKSDLQKGSEFEITVDITGDVVFKRGEPVNAAKATASTEASSPAVTAKPSEGRVLIVDDSEDNRVMMAAYLEKSNYDFDMAENGLEGVEKAMAQNYDMVLMDIQMPKMDGFEAIKYLRDKNYDGTVVAVTAHAMKGYRERCLSNGFDDYLCKPLSWSALADVLNKFTVHQ